MLKDGTYVVTHYWYLYLLTCYCIVHQLCACHWTLSTY